MKQEFDRVASSAHIRKDVNRAVQILEDEGYRRYGESAMQMTFTKAGADYAETVFVFRGELNGTMIFNSSDGESRTIMAWDYVRQKRPNPVQKAVDKVSALIAKAF